MWATNGIQFKGCRFEYSAGNLYTPAFRGMGIYSIDAIYTVNRLISGSSVIPSKFIKMNTGIYVGNFNPLKVVTVTNSEFSKNERDGVHFENMHGFVLENNQFTTPGNGNSANGLYLDKCKNFNVRLNSFTQNSSSAQGEIGIYVYDSGAGSHEIYGNNFSNLLIGICPQGNNSSYPTVSNGLRMNCNNFIAGSPNQYDIAMLDVGSVPATASIWQSNFNNTNPQGLVRNVYGASSMCGNCENRWYIDNTSVQQMFHYNHNDASTRITPQPDYADNSLITVNVSWLNLNYSTHCPGVQGGRYAVAHYQMLSYMNDYVTELRQDNEDGHNDQDIIETIAAKLNFLLTDSVYSDVDSVISLFSSYPNEMENSGVMKVFAYMHKHDYSGAQSAIDELPVEKSDWVDLLTQMVYLEQHPEELHDIANNTSLRAMFESYATTEGKDGQGSAKALMEMATGEFYEVPRLVPGSGSKVAFVGQLADDAKSISVFPNPSNDLMNVIYRATEEGMLNLVVTDTQGRKIYESNLDPGAQIQIPVKEFSEGLYFLNAYKGKKSIQVTKLVVAK
jgi:hypothetical protein